MTALRLAVFDIDGTLVDSRAAILEAAQIAAREIGVAEPPYDRVRQGVGLSLDEALALMAPDLDGEGLAAFADAYRNAFRAMHERPGFSEPLYDGAAELLDGLKSEGWTLALATGQSRKGVARNLARQGWADLFVSSHCAEDGPGKPDPAMLHAAMKASGATPHQTTMIGDTAHDIRMALAADVAPVAVGWGFHTEAELLGAGAAHVLTDFTALQSALRDWNAALSPAI
jgi:phosphoglycolate phosphatase